MFSYLFWVFKGKKYKNVLELPKNDFKDINKPKGLKVAKEDQKADRHDGRYAEIGILSYGMMVFRQRGAEIGILSYGIMVVRHSELLITDRLPNRWTNGHLQFQSRFRD